MQKDYSQFSLTQLYKLYTEALNKNSEEGKNIFEEILLKEKKVINKAKAKNHKFLKAFYLIASLRNVSGYIFIYLVLRFNFVAGIFNIAINHTLDDIMSIFFYIFLFFLIAGTIASTQVKKITGQFSHTIYLKRELIIVSTIVVLLEIFYLN